MGRRNTTGGYNKDKKRRNFKQEVITKLDDEQIFGQIIKNNGSHWDVLCSDNVKRIGRLTSSMRTGQRLTVGSQVVISLRDESDKTHCDIIGLASIPKNVMAILQPQQANTADDIIFGDSDNEEFNEFEESHHVRTDSTPNNDDWDNL